MAALKGAFLKFGAGLLGALPNVVVFQFNPDRVSRTPSLAQPRPGSDGSGGRNAREQPGEPSESISFTLRLDATDQLASGNPLAVAGGILPALSALELLMVPKASLPLNLGALAGAPGSHLHPAQKLPTVLFFWGPLRILPVKVSRLDITETEYDTRLNPVRAEIAVSLDVLTPSQLAKDGAFERGAYDYTQGAKEVMAALNLANAAQIGVSSVLSFSL